MQCLSRTIGLKTQMNKSFIKTKAALKKKHVDQHDILRLYKLDKTVHFRRFLGNYWPSLGDNGCNVGTEGTKYLRK